MAGEKYLPAPVHDMPPRRMSFQLLAEGAAPLVYLPARVSEHPQASRALTALITRPPFEGGLATPDAWEDLLAAVGGRARVFVVDRAGERWEVMSVEFDPGGFTGQIRVRHQGRMARQGDRLIDLQDAYGYMIPIVVYKPYRTNSAPGWAPRVWDMVRLKGRGQRRTWSVRRISGGEVELSPLWGTLEFNEDRGNWLVTSLNRIRPAYKGNPFELTGPQIVGKVIGWTATGAVSDVITSRINRWITRPVAEAAEGVIVRGAGKVMGTAKNPSGEERLRRLGRRAAVGGQEEERLHFLERLRRGDVKLGLEGLEGYLDLFPGQTVGQIAEYWARPPLTVSSLLSILRQEDRAHSDRNVRYDALRDVLTSPTRAALKKVRQTAAREARWSAGPDYSFYYLPDLLVDAAIDVPHPEGRESRDTRVRRLAIVAKKIRAAVLGLEGAGLPDEAEFSREYLKVAEALLRHFKTGGRWDNWARDEALTLLGNLRGESGRLYRVLPGSNPGDPRKEVYRILKEVRARRVETKGRGYPRWELPNGVRFVVPKTPSDWRSWKNSLATLKRLLRQPVPEPPKSSPPESPNGKKGKKKGRKRRNPEDEEFRVICAWCEKILEEGPPGARVSHGICRECLEAKRHGTHRNP